MRGITAFAGSTLAFMSSWAHAGVSDDLVFCSKLQSSRERIACYDAAARIAARPAAARVTPPQPSSRALMTREAADHPLPSEVTPIINKFAGAFLSLGGSYGIASPRQVNLPTAGFGFSDTLSATGWSGRAAAGYNATLGNFFFGAELAGRFGEERASVSVITAAPAFFNVTGAAFSSYQIKNDAGIHVAGRVGAIFDNTLVFIRGGVGTSHVTESAVFDASRLTPCNFIAGCTPWSPTKSAWIPSAVIGAGAEYNFGRFFVRAEGEIEALALHNTILPNAGSAGVAAEPYWFARVMASVGFRF